MNEPLAREGRQALDIVCGLIISSIVAAAIIALCSWTGRLSPSCFTAPPFSARSRSPCLRRRAYLQSVSPVTAGLAGLIIGGLPIVFGWMIDSSGAIRAAELLKELVPAAVGGICGGLIFWVVVRPLPAPKWRWTFLKLALAAATIGAAYLVPEPPIDPTCHNPLRMAENPSAPTPVSISISAWINGRPLRRKWMFLRALGVGLCARCAARFRLRWFQFSLCKEAGTNIQATNFPPSSDAISFIVYQPQGGSSWQGEFRSLYHRLNAHWPGQITFSGEDGRIIPAPDWTREPTSHR